MVLAPAYGALLVVPHLFEIAMYLAVTLTVATRAMGFYRSVIFAWMIRLSLFNSFFVSYVGHLLPSGLRCKRNDFHDLPGVVRRDDSVTLGVFLAG